jgi:hypothetical protein
MSNELTQANEETPKPRSLAAMEADFLEDLDAYINKKISVYHLHHVRMGGPEKEAKMAEGETELNGLRQELSLSLRNLVVHGSKRPGV